MHGALLYIMESSYSPDYLYTTRIRFIILTALPFLLYHGLFREVAGSELGVWRLDVLGQPDGSPAKAYTNVDVQWSVARMQGKACHVGVFFRFIISNRGYIW